MPENPSSVFGKTAWFGRPMHLAVSGLFSQISSSRRHAGHQSWMRLRVFFVLFLFVLSSSVLAQDPATVGQWSPVMTWPYEAIHAHLLPTGKVMFWDRGDHSQFWDPATNAVNA